MKKIFTTILLTFLCYIALAQTTIYTDSRAYDKTEYLFSIGDTIMFFPFNPEYKGIYNPGYSCFYDIDCMEKGFKSKYRFATDKSKITPHSEIDDHFFYVKSINSASFNTEHKLYFSAVLERIKDHKLICIAYPSSLKKESKESILHTWAVLDKSDSRYLWGRNSLVLPFLTKRFIDWLHSLEGKPVIMRSNYLKSNENYSMLEFANGESRVKKLNNIGKSREFVVRRAQFLPLGNELYYSQPYVTIFDSIDMQTYSIPASHFVGNCNIRYVIRGEAKNLFDKHFLRSDILLARLKAESPKRDTLIGKLFYFDRNSYYYKKENKWIDKETSLLNNNNLYSLTNGYYKCIGFDFFRKPDNFLDYYSQYAIFEDSIGQHFRFPVTVLYKTEWSSTQKIDFTKIFESKDEKEEKERHAIQKEENKKRLIAKYGEDVGFAIWVGKCTENRYNALCKKYGKKKAGWMARHIYDVGWTYEEFCEAKNPIVKLECVYTHENRYAYYEVYKYGDYSPTYITFKNNVIVSIDDYMNSDF